MIYTGSFALQEINGIVRVVNNCSFLEESLPAAISAGTEQPKPIPMEYKLSGVRPKPERNLPARLNACSKRLLSSKIDKKKKRAAIMGKNVITLQTPGNRPSAIKLVM